MVFTRELGATMQCAVPFLRASNTSSPDWYSVTVAVGNRLSSAFLLINDDLVQAMFWRSLFRLLPVWMAVRDMVPNDTDCTTPVCSANQ